MGALAAALGRKDVPFSITSSCALGQDRVLAEKKLPRTPAPIDLRSLASPQGVEFKSKSGMAVSIGSDEDGRRVSLKEESASIPAPTQEYGILLPRKLILILKPLYLTSQPA